MKLLPLGQRVPGLNSHNPKIQYCLEKAQEEEVLYFLDFPQQHAQLVGSNILEYARHCSEHFSESESGESVLPLMERVLDAHLETEVMPLMALKLALHYPEHFSLNQRQEAWLQENIQSIKDLYISSLKLFSVHQQAVQFYTRHYSIHYLVARHAFENGAFEALETVDWEKFFPVVRSSELAAYFEGKGCLEEFKKVALLEVRHLIGALLPQVSKKPEGNQALLKKSLPPKSKFTPLTPPVEVPIAHIFQKMTLQDASKTKPLIDHQPQSLEDSKSVLKEFITQWLFQEACKKTGFTVVGAKKLQAEKEILFNHAGKHFIRQSEVANLLSLKIPSLELLTAHTQNKSLHEFLADDAKTICTSFVIEDEVPLETYLNTLLKNEHTVETLENEEIIKLSHPIPALVFEKIKNEGVAVYKVETSTLRYYFDTQRIYTVYPIKEI